MQHIILDENFANVLWMGFNGRNWAEIYNVDSTIRLSEALEILGKPQIGIIWLVPRCRYNGGNKYHRMKTEKY